MKHIAVLFGLLSLLAPWAALASDFQQQQNPLYPFRSSIFVQDDFISGSGGSGAQGNLGWFSSGTVTLISSTGSDIGLLTLDTGAVSGTQARITLLGTSVGIFNPSLNVSIMWRSRINTNDANTTVRYGLANNASSNPPADGIFFEKLAADTNWFCVTRAGAVQTRTDSGVATTANFSNFSFTRNSSGVVWSIDQVSVCGTHTTDITAVFLTPIAWIINTAAAAKTITVDYFEVRQTGLTR